MLCNNETFLLKVVWCIMVNIIINQWRWWWWWCLRLWWRNKHDLINDSLFWFCLCSYFVLGLSNFNSKQIEEVWGIAEIKPAVLQCESHPYLIQKKLINYCKEKGIICKLSFYIRKVLNHRTNFDVIETEILIEIVKSFLLSWRKHVPFLKW